jgi:hypothetical protein
VKARLDIKVAIYKEPAGARARATLLAPMIRISIHTYIRAHTYARARIRTRRNGGAARKRTRGGTGRSYLHIESVS